MIAVGLLTIIVSGGCDGGGGNGKASGSSGAPVAGKGIDGTGALQIRLGDVIAREMSGGWRVRFALRKNATVAIRFNYKLVQGSEMESNELLQALVSLDGETFHTDNGRYLAQLVGNGNGGEDETTGWREFQTSVKLSAGTHDLMIGVRLNTSSAADEFGEFYGLSVIAIGSE